MFGEPRNQVVQATAAEMLLLRCAPTPEFSALLMRLPVITGSGVLAESAIGD